MHAATGDFNRSGKYHGGSELCCWTRRRNYLATPDRSLLRVMYALLQLCQRSTYLSNPNSDFRITTQSWQALPFPLNGFLPPEEIRTEPRELYFKPNIPVREASVDRLMWLCSHVPRTTGLVVVRRPHFQSAGGGGPLSSASSFEGPAQPP
ncbi:hypothetical protein BC826DRAFT_653422 [Russula brevipes]|nr:hypothetical protein BC826DRAFT_653422 [Russula brevipes]